MSEVIVGALSVILDDVLILFTVRFLHVSLCQHQGQRIKTLVRSTKGFSHLTFVNVG